MRLALLALPFLAACQTGSPALLPGSTVTVDGREYLVSQSRSDAQQYLARPALVGDGQPLGDPLRDRVGNIAAIEAATGCKVNRDSVVTGYSGLSYSSHFALVDC